MHLFEIRLAAAFLVDLALRGKEDLKFEARLSGTDFSDPIGRLLSNTFYLKWCLRARSGWGWEKPLRPALYETHGGHTRCWFVILNSLYLKWFWECIEGSARHHFRNQNLLFVIYFVWQFETGRAQKVFFSIWISDFGEFLLCSNWNHWNTPEYLLIDWTAFGQPNLQKKMKNCGFLIFPK